MPFTPDLEDASRCRERREYPGRPTSFLAPDGAASAVARAVTGCSTARGPALSLADPRGCDPPPRVAAEVPCTHPWHGAERIRSREGSRHPSRRAIQAPTQPVALAAGSCVRTTPRPGAANQLEARHEPCRRARGNHSDRSGMAAQSSIEIEIHSPTSCIVTLHGEHDMASREAVTMALALTRDYSRVLVDLTTCTFIDATVTNALLAAAARLQDGRSLELVVPAASHPVRRLLSVAGFLRAFRSTCHAPAAWRPSTRRSGGASPRDVNCARCPTKPLARPRREQARRHDGAPRTRRPTRTDPHGTSHPPPRRAGVSRRRNACRHGLWHAHEPTDWHHSLCTKSHTSVFDRACRWHMRDREPPMNGTRPTVLVCDDESVLRELIRATLGGGRYTVIEARDGDEALAQAGASSPTSSCWT